jgi:hypothetical protein
VWVSETQWCTLEALEAFHQQSPLWRILRARCSFPPCALWDCCGLEKYKSYSEHRVKAELKTPVVPKIKWSTGSGVWGPPCHKAISKPGIPLFLMSWTPVTAWRGYV